MPLAEAKMIGTHGTDWLEVPSLLNIQGYSWAGMAAGWWYWDGTVLQ